MGTIIGEGITFDDVLLVPQYSEVTPNMINYFVDFVGLCLNRHVFVNDADTALSCHRNGHSMFRDRIHRAYHRTGGHHLR